jgi:hypothetical protein
LYTKRRTKWAVQVRTASERDKPNTAAKGG